MFITASELRVAASMVHNLTCPGLEKNPECSGPEQKDFDAARAAFDSLGISIQEQGPGCISARP